MVSETFSSFFLIISAILNPEYWVSKDLRKSSTVLVHEMRITSIRIWCEYHWRNIICMQTALNFLTCLIYVEEYKNLSKSFLVPLRQNVFSYTKMQIAVCLPLRPMRPICGIKSKMLFRNNILIVDNKKYYLRFQIRTNIFFLLISWVSGSFSLKRRK